MNILNIFKFKFKKNAYNYSAFIVENGASKKVSISYIKERNEKKALKEVRKYLKANNIYIVSDSVQKVSIK